MIDKSIIYPVEVLRGLVHTALESTIVHKKYDAIQRKVILEGVDTIVAVLNDGHRSSADILPNHSGFQRVDLENPRKRTLEERHWKRKGYEPEGRRRLINVTNNLEVSTGIRLVKTENLIVIASDAYKMLYTKKTFKEKKFLNLS